MARGLFITLEGTDGSGISTQTALLASWLRANGHPVHATKEPSSGPVGLLLRLALAHRLGAPSDTAFHPLDETAMALLFAADRMDHLHAEILPRLEQGTWVVSDRYTLSTYAFQGINLDTDWLRALNREARVPNLTVLIDVPVEVSIERMHVRGAVERYEQASTLTRVRDNFHRLVPLLQAEGQRIAVVDGTASPEEVHAAIVQEVSALEPVFPE